METRKRRETVPHYVGENYHSSDFQLQWKLDFRMNGLNFEKLVDLAHPALGKYDTQLRKTIPTEKRQNSW